MLLVDRWEPWVGEHGAAQRPPLCSSASDSDCCGTRVGCVRPSGSTGDLVAASLGCAQALRCLRGCAKVTPLWRQRWGPGNPPPATTCGTDAGPASHSTGSRPASCRSLPRLSRSPLPTVGWGARSVPGPRARSKHGGRAGQPRPGRCHCVGCQPRAHHPVLSFQHVCGWARGRGRGVCHLRCSARRL